MKNQIILLPHMHFCQKFRLELLLKRTKSKINTPKSTSLNVNFRPFRTKLDEIIFKKANVSEFDNPSIKVYASWRTRSSIQGSKKPLPISEYVNFNDELDYEG